MIVRLLEHKFGVQLGRNLLFWDWPGEGMRWFAWGWTPIGSRWTVWKAGPLSLHRANRDSVLITGPGIPPGATISREDADRLSCSVRKPPPQKENS